MKDLQPTSLKRTQRDYSLSFKYQVVREVESGELSIGGALRKYGIQSHGTVLNWIRKYGTLDRELQVKFTMEKSPEQKLMELEAKVRLLERQKESLEKQLKFQQDKAIMFDMMIDIAENELNIPIRKKSVPRSIERFKEERQETMIYTCDVFGISRQAYYKQKESLRIKQEQAEDIIAKVHLIRQSMPRIGTRKLYYLLDGQLSVGRDKLFCILRANQMLIKPVRSYTKTTMSKHWLHKHPNLLKDIDVYRPEQVYVSDITYIKSRQRTHYLSLVTDAYSRKIVGYHLSDDLNAESVVKALKMAVKCRDKNIPLIHHSDRGLQYCSAIYQNVLKNNKITPSMTDGYDCYQNALAERINGILKQEFLFGKCNNYMDLNMLIKQSVNIYNNKRPHLALKMKTPNFVHQKQRTDRLKTTDSYYILV
nr:IS3 family transposase [Dysgonomonas sp. 216]